MNSFFVRDMVELYRQHTNADLYERQLQMLNSLFRSGAITREQFEHSERVLKQNMRVTEKLVVNS